MKLRDDYDKAKRQLSERAEKSLQTVGYSREVKKLRLLIELIKEQVQK